MGHLSKQGDGLVSNCDIWGTVDFGKGPVEIRCTLTGPHTEHQCYILFPKPVEDPKPIDKSQWPTTNVFDQPEGLLTDE